MGYFPAIRQSIDQEVNESSLETRLGLRGFLKITRDLSERRKLEVLQIADRQKDRFLATGSHELRTHLKAEGATQRSEAICFRRAASEKRSTISANWVESARRAD